MVTNIHCIPVSHYLLFFLLEFGNSNYNVNPFPCFHMTYPISVHFRLSSKHMYLEKNPYFYYTESYMRIPVFDPIVNIVGHLLAQFGN